MKTNFDMYSMTGVTPEDCKAILDHIDREIDLFIDEFDRVWSEADIYIADARRGEPGEGIGC